MNILKEWFLGNWNSQCILYDYEEIEYELWNKIYKFKDCAPITQFIMFLIFLVSNIIFFILHPFKYFLFTIWISPTSDVGSQIKANLNLLKEKQFVYGGLDY